MSLSHNQLLNHATGDSEPLFTMFSSSIVRVEVRQVTGK